MIREPTLRERKKRQARLDLVRSAVTLFREQGFEATTVDQIAAHANYSPRTFFRFFGSKEDVVFVEIPLLMDEFRAGLTGPVTAENAWAVARRALTDQVLSFTTVVPDLELQCVALWFAEPALRRRYAEVLSQWERTASQFLQDAWGPTSAFEAKVAGCALIGVARTVVEEQVSDETTIRLLLEVGFDVLERGPSGGPARLEGSGARSLA